MKYFIILTDGKKALFARRKGLSYERADLWTETQVRYISESILLQAEAHKMQVGVFAWPAGVR